MCSLKRSRLGTASEWRITLIKIKTNNATNITVRNRCRRLFTNRQSKAVKPASVNPSRRPLKIPKRIHKREQVIHNTFNQLTYWNLNPHEHANISRAGRNQQITNSTFSYRRYIPGYSADGAYANDRLRIGMPWSPWGSLNLKVPW